VLRNGGLLVGSSVGLLGLDDLAPAATRGRAVVPHPLHHLAVFCLEVGHDRLRRRLCRWRLFGQVGRSHGGEIRGCLPRVDPAVDVRVERRFAPKLDLFPHVRRDAFSFRFLRPLHFLFRRRLFLVCRRNRACRTTPIVRDFGLDAVVHHVLELEPDVRIGRMASSAPVLVFPSSFDFGGGCRHVGLHACGVRLGGHCLVSLVGARSDERTLYRFE